MQSAISVLDSHMPLEQLAEHEGAEVDGPDPITGLLKAQVFADATVETLTQRRFHRMPPLALT